MSKANYSALWQKAHAAGMAAGNGSAVAPMVVTQGDVLGRPVPGARSHYVADGVCGFAGVKVPGNSGFGKWAKAAGLARPGYPSGLYISCREFNQSMQRKEAYAQAAADVLRAAGIKAYSESRMD